MLWIQWLVDGKISVESIPVSLKSSFAAWHLSPTQLKESLSRSQNELSSSGRENKLSPVRPRPRAARCNAHTSYVNAT